MENDNLVENVSGYKECRSMLGYKKLENFIYGACRNNNNIFAASSAYNDLISGKTLDDIFANNESPFEETGYYISVKKQQENNFIFDFGFYAGSDAGVGGTWRVIFNEDDSVKSISGDWDQIF